MKNKLFRRSFVLFFSLLIAVSCFVPVSASAASDVLTGPQQYSFDIPSTSLDPVVLPSSFPSASSNSFVFDNNHANWSFYAQGMGEETYLFAFYVPLDSSASVELDTLVVDDIPSFTLTISSGEVLVAKYYTDAFDLGNSPSLSSSGHWVTEILGSSLFDTGYDLATEGDLYYGTSVSITGDDSYVSSSPSSLSISSGRVSSSSVLGVFSGIGEWFVRFITSFVSMFYTAESGLTFLGYLAVAGLAIAVFFLFFALISRFLKFGG